MRPFTLSWWAAYIRCTAYKQGYQRGMDDHEGADDNFYSQEKLRRLNARDKYDLVSHLDFAERRIRKYRS